MYSLFVGVRDNWNDCTVSRLDTGEVECLRGWTSTQLNLGEVGLRRLDLGAARSDGGSRRHDAVLDATECRDEVTRRTRQKNECDEMSRRLDEEVDEEQLSSRRLKDAEFTEVERRSSRKLSDGMPRTTWRHESRILTKDNCVL